MLGATHLQLEDDVGEDTYLWVPRSTVNLTVSSRIPNFTQLTLGLTGKWQSGTSNVDGYSGGTISQDAYTTFNVFGRYQLSDKASLRANVYNVTDEKYILSLYQIGYYAAPRNYSLSFDYKL